MIIMYTCTFFRLQSSVTKSLTLRESKSCAEKKVGFKMLCYHLFVKHLQLMYCMVMYMYLCIWVYGAVHDKISLY